jgi:hypothetical protein
METTQKKPGPRELKMTKIVLALAFLTLAAGFSSPPKPNCRQVPPGQTGEPPEVIVFKCQGDKMTYRFTPWSR